MITLRFFTPAQVGIDINVTVNTRISAIKRVIASKFSLNENNILLYYKTTKLNDSTIVKYIPYYTGGIFNIKFNLPLIHLLEFDAKFKIELRQIIAKVQYLLTINQNKEDCLRALLFGRGSLYTALELLLDGTTDIIKTFKNSRINQAALAQVESIQPYVAPEEPKQPTIKCDLSELYQFIYEPLKKNENNLVSNINQDLTEDSADENASESSRSPQKQETGSTQTVNLIERPDEEINKADNSNPDIWHDLLNMVNDDKFFEINSISVETAPHSEPSDSDPVPEPKAEESSDTSSEEEEEIQKEKKPLPPRPTRGRQRRSYPLHDPSNTVFEVKVNIPEITNLRKNIKWVELLENEETDGSDSENDDKSKEQEDSTPTEPKNDQTNEDEGSTVNTTSNEQK